MNIREIIIRGQNLLINPSSEFKRISIEKPNVIRINREYVTVVSLFVAILALVGSAISHLASPLNSFIYVLINAVIVFLLIFTHNYVSGKTIALLGRNIAAEGRSSNYYALSSYSQLPFYLVLALIKLFPSLIFLIFIGFYSGLLFYTGIGAMTKIPDNKRIQFTVLSMLIMIISFVIFSELYTLLYGEIIAEFSTFAAS